MVASMSCLWVAIVGPANTPALAMKPLIPRIDRESDHEGFESRFMGRMSSIEGAGKLSLEESGLEVARADMDREAEEDMDSPLFLPRLLKKDRRELELEDAEFFRKAIGKVEALHA